MNQAAEHSQRRRFAGAVGTEQRNDLARYELERHVVHGEARVESAREM
jgi:hypothetical protein